MSSELVGGSWPKGASITLLFYAWTCPLFIQHRLSYQKKLEPIPSPDFQKEWQEPPVSPFQVQSSEEICYYSVQPLASARPHLHTRGFTRMIAPIWTVKQYLVHKVSNFPRKWPNMAVILAGNSSADLPDFISGLSCTTKKKSLLVRSKFQRVVLC